MAAAIRVSRIIIPSVPLNDEMPLDTLRRLWRRTKPCKLGPLEPASPVSSRRAAWCSCGWWAYTTYLGRSRRVIREKALRAWRRDHLGRTGYRG